MMAEYTNIHQILKNQHDHMKRVAILNQGNIENCKGISFCKLKHSA